MKREKKELIINYVKGNELSNREDLIAIIQDSVAIPEYAELAKRYMANIVAQIVATVKDEKGNRWVLARRNAEDIQFVNTKKCRDLEILKNIEKRIEKDIQGRQSSLKQVRVSISAVQINMFDYLKETEQYRVASSQ